MKKIIATILIATQIIPITALASNEKENTLTLTYKNESIVSQKDYEENKPIITINGTDIPLSQPIQIMEPKSNFRLVINNLSETSTNPIMVKNTDSNNHKNKIKFIRESKNSWVITGEPGVYICEIENNGIKYEFNVIVKKDIESRITKMLNNNKEKLYTLENTSTYQKSDLRIIDEIINNIKDMINENILEGKNTDKYTENHSSLLNQLSNSENIKKLIVSKIEIKQEQENKKEEEKNLNKFNEYKNIIELKIPNTIIKRDNAIENLISNLSKNYPKVKFKHIKNKSNIIEIEIKYDIYTYNFKIKQIEIKVNPAIKDTVEQHKGWSKKAVSTMYNKGILTGNNNGQLRLNDNITYAEAFKLIDQLGLVNEITTDNVNNKYLIDSKLDKHKSKWYYDTTFSILSKYKQSQLHKFDMKNINNPITREEVAQILTSIYKDKMNINPKPIKIFKDIYQITDKEAIAFVTQTKLMVGYNDNVFKPKGKITREEMIQMLYNLDNMQKGEL